MVDLIKRLPAVRPKLDDKFDPTKTPCFCGTYVPVEECKVAWSGFTNYIVAVCPDHKKEFDERARVVCPRCRMLVMLVPPHRERLGFEFVAGKVYHVEHCYFCKPDKPYAAIVEKKLFYKRNGILYDEGNQLLA